MKGGRFGRTWIPVAVTAWIARTTGSEGNVGRPRGRLVRFGRSNVSREELPILPVPNNENEKESYMMETTKKCSTCGRVLPVEEFHKNKRCKDGLMPFCKECHLKSTRSGGRRKKSESVSPVSQPIQPIREVQPFTACVTEKDCATEALKLAIGKDAFAEWKAANELYECLLKYYSR